MPAQPFRAAAVILGVLAALAAPAAGQTLNISNSPGLRSVSPRIATDTQGNIHAVWVEMTGATSGDVFYAKGTLSTLQISSPLKLSNSNGLYCSTMEMCSLDVDGLDRVYVVWAERYNGENRLIMRTNTGGSWDAGTVVASGPAFEAPRIAVTPGGDVFIIFWTNEWHVFSRARISGVWEEAREMGVWANPSKMPDIAIGTNMVGAAWVEKDAYSDYRTVYSQRSRSYGASWSGRAIVAPMADPHQHPAVEMDANDVGHVIWTTLDEGSGNRIVHYVRTSGGGFTSPEAVSAWGHLHYPYLTERGNELYAVWQVGSYGNGSGVDYNIRGADGIWKGVSSVPSSNGCTYTDVAVTPDRSIVFFIWDTYLESINAEIYGWAKAFLVMNPALTVSRDRLAFGAVAGGALTPAQAVLVTNSGSGSKKWAAATEQGWIQISPASGVEKGAIQISVNPAGLGAGSYQGAVAVYDPDLLGQFAPRTIVVSLTVYAAGGATTAAPFGAFDTPVSGSTVRSSLAVTGWALDDIGVGSVKLYRDPVAGEPAGAWVFVGDVVFVEGARSDVEIAFPAHPRNYRAGWGYMLLTNMLPNGGNGTFVLWAQAVDLEGRTVNLGSKTIVAANATATKPFGAIDTPAQGGIASGSAYNNFGWALTPMPNSIPVDGSTIGVWVNGVLVGNPSYNHYREDIARLFPGYANSNGAVGLRVLDTTAYANGVHTIAWGVSDSARNEDGIGSRFFNIVNTTAASSASPRELSSALSSLPVPAPLEKAFELEAWPTDVRRALHVRTGYDPGLPTSPVSPEGREAEPVVVRELGRVEILLDEEAWTADLVRRIGEAASAGPRRPGGYEGYLIVGDSLRPLPAGSTLNAAAGVFSWGVGPGFLGDYRLVFVQRGAGRKTFVTVRVVPKS